MQHLFGSSGSSGFGKTSWENGTSTGNATAFESNEKNIIYQANTVSFPLIFKQYSIKCDEFIKKIACPLPEHNDRTPSFNYYPDHNTYYCFGCKSGNRPCDFVAEMENISKKEAAEKIIKLFEEEVDFENIVIENQHDKLKLMMEFSDLIREVIVSADQETFHKLEKICQAYDKINSKYILNYEALKSVVGKLTLQVNKLK